MKLQENLFLNKHVLKNENDILIIIKYSITNIRLIIHKTGK